MPWLDRVLVKDRLESKQKFDSISYQRSAVERHGQNRRLANDFPNLLDCLSDVLEWLAAKNKDLVQVCLPWIKSPKKLFRRFAIFVMHKSKFYTSDEKTLWLMEQDLIFDYDTHHEVFGLLKESYPDTSQQNRIHLIAQIVKGPQKPEDREDRKEWERYPSFKVLSWLQSADKSCGLVKAEIDKIKTVHPDYQQREHADLHGYVREAVWVGSAGNQGGFTTVRIAHDGDAVIATQLFEDFIYLPLATEEQVALINGKWTKSRKRVLHGGFYFLQNR